MARDLRAEAIAALVPVMIGCVEPYCNACVDPESATRSYAEQIIDLVVDLTNHSDPNYVTDVLSNALKEMKAHALDGGWLFQ